MSALGQKETCAVQTVISALPPIAVEIADIAPRWRTEHFCSALSSNGLPRYDEGIVDIHAEVPHRALYLGLPEQKLDGSQNSPRFLRETLG
jgi:hypothetical protein